MTYKNPNPKLSDILSVTNLQKRIAEGYITVSKSGTKTLYCYSKSAQYEQMWDQETMACRGLIVDGSDNVIARPFPKFFNYGQVELPEWVQGRHPLVSEKIDGSLGICFWNGQNWQIATKGSFQSDQAKEANTMLQGVIDINDENAIYGIGTTALFEIVYPGNRIVVNYGSSSFLCLLAVIQNRTGEDLGTSSVKMKVIHTPSPGNLANGSPRYDDISAIEFQAKSLSYDDREGLVACWERSGAPSFRMKFKNGKYLRLHGLMTRMTARKIWEILKEEGFQSVTEYISDAPDEFQEWAIKTADNLLAAYNAIHKKTRRDCLIALRKVNLDFGGIEPISRETRKEFVTAVSGVPNRSLLFKLLDGQSIDEDVWKLVYPAHETPFMAAND